MTGATELRTERLLLRPFSLSDVDDVLEYGSDPEWAAFYDHPYDRGEAEDMVARAVLTSWDEHPWFALELDGRVIGMAVLSLERRDIANLGYDVARPHWGKGLAPEAARAVVDWGFREMGLIKVAAFTNPRNRQSWRVMEKLGMTREGLMRRGQGRDLVAYGVLREDWTSAAGPLPPAPERPAEPAAAVPELRTKRLVLRRFGPGDVDDVFDYARDPEWAEFLLIAVPQPYTRRNAEEFIAGKMRASPEQEPTWAIALDGTVVGAIGLSVDARRDTGELHYGLGRSYWGRGIMPEAVAAVVDWGFQERALAKISARADLRNRRSWRVMEKLGMTREGVRRSQGKDARPGYPRTDDVYYGLLREEWELASGGPPEPGIDGGHPAEDRVSAATGSAGRSRFRSPFSPGGRRLG